MTVRADLDGLGPTAGPVFTWTVPGDFALAQPPVGLPSGFTPIQATSGTNAPGWTTWLGLACLLLVIVLLLTRIGSKGPLR